MNRIALGIMLFAFVPSILCSSVSAGDRPNIILILADDLGWQDTGFTGSDFYETPNLDRLAKQGMVFRQAYAAAGNCVPSRACLISGQYTPRHGVYAVGDTERGQPELMRMIPIPSKTGLPAGDFTIAKAMKSAGYTTALIGKWHLGGLDGSTPQQQGFDVVELSGDEWSSDKPDDPKGIFSITASAGKFMEENRDRPFFLFLSHYAPHAEHQSRPETRAHFDTKGTIHSERAFASCIFDLDAGIGILLDKMKTLGLDDNTLLVFASDNGGSKGSQEPLRGKKGSYYEGGIRVPMIVRWPGVVEAGSMCDVPIVNIDFYPTFAVIAGAKLPSDRVLDGANIESLFRGATKFDRQSIYWHFPGYLESGVPRGRDRAFRTRPVSVVQRGDWKLLLYHEEWQLDGGRDRMASNRSVELYNIVDDPGEHNDQAASNPLKRDELLDDLLAWMQKTHAPMPTQPNRTYDPNAKITTKTKN